MTTRTTPLPSWLVVLFACIFALVTVGCGGSSELAPAKSAPGQPGADYDAAEAEAAPVAAGSDAPAEAPAPPAPLGLDEKALAQGGAPPKTQSGPAVADVPTPAPGISPSSELPSAAGREPLLIYTATMTLAVFGTKDAISAVEELARSRGGYLVSRGDETVTIRVPT